eukprot:scaffold36541_cov23-Tisochrysis_lutea.AAC.1
MAHRLLVLSPASSTQPLSSMLVNPGRSVHRWPKRSQFPRAGCHGCGCMVLEMPWASSASA